MGNPILHLIAICNLVLKPFITLYKLNIQYIYIYTLYLYIYTLYLKYESIWPGENIIKDLAGFDILQQAMWQICLWTWRPRPNIGYVLRWWADFPNGKFIIWNSWLGNLTGICWCFLEPWNWWNPHQTIYKWWCNMDFTSQQHAWVCVWKWSGLQQSNMANQSPEQVQVCSRVFIIEQI